MTTKLTKLGLIAMLIAVLAAATGCGRGDTADGQIKVVYVIPSLDNEAYKADVEFARQAAEANGNVEFEVMAGTDATDVEEHISNLRTAVTTGADAVIIVATDSKALAAPIEQARRTTKVIAVGVPIEGAEVDATVLFPDFEGGQVAGKHLAQNVPDGSTVGILTCHPGETFSTDRIAGARSQWQDKNFDIAATLDANCDNAKGKAVMTDMLSAHPDLDAVFSVSDSQSVGAATALESLGDDRPFFVSYDAQPTALQLLKNGKIDADVDINLAEGGRQALKLAVQAARGQKHPEAVEIPPRIVTSSNVDAILKQAHHAVN